MTWSMYLRRLAWELVLFFLVSSSVFYFAAGRESVTGAIVMGAIATIFYGGITYILRQRSIRPDERR